MPKPECDVRYLLIPLHAIKPYEAAMEALQRGRTLGPAEEMLDQGILEAYLECAELLVSYVVLLTGKPVLN